MGKRYLQDVLETMSEYVDSLKFAGGSFTLMPRPALVELLNLCHEHNVLVSTGGFLEYVLTQGAEAVDHYVRECREVGFDIIEISCGFITIPTDDWLRLIEKVQKAGMKAKPEVGIQFGGRRSHKSRRTGSGRHAGSTVVHQTGPALSRRRRLPHHDRIRRDHRKRPDLAHGCPCTDRGCPGTREGDV